PPVTHSRSSFRGNLIRSGDAEYDAARRIHNGLIDKRPTLIAQCRGAADVAAALELARDFGLPVSVRGGGHNVAGRAVVEGGMMIDLSLARAVRVDPIARTAVAEGGATWADFNRATQAHGLATTGGLVADNLIAAQIVTADGRILNANETDHPDLFWAIRGCGGNFGVAASLTFK